MPLAILTWATKVSGAALESLIYHEALGLIALLVIFRYVCCNARLSLPPGVISAHRCLHPFSVLLGALAIAEVIVALPLLLFELLLLVLDAVPQGWVEKIPGLHPGLDNWFDRTVALRLADVVSASAAFALGVVLAMLFRRLTKRRTAPSRGRPTALLVTAAVLLALALCGDYLEFGLPHLRPLGLLASDVLYALLVLLYAILPAFLITDGIAALADLVRGSSPTPDPSPVLPAPDDQPDPPAG